MSIGFDRVRVRRRDEIPLNKNVNGKSHLRKMPKDVFGFAEHQEQATYGLGYKLTITRRKDECVIDKAAGIADIRNKIDHTHWYLPHYTASIQQQSILSDQILKRTLK